MYSIQGDLIENNSEKKSIILFGKERDLQQILKNLIANNGHVRPHGASHYNFLIMLYTKHKIISILVNTLFNHI